MLIKRKLDHRYEQVSPLIAGRSSEKNCFSFVQSIASKTHSCVARRKLTLFKAINMLFFYNFLDNKKTDDNLSSVYYDPYGIRTRVTAVKGRCLNRLTKGPKYMAEKEGFEPSRRLPDLHP